VRPRQPLPTARETAGRIVERNGAATASRFRRFPPPWSVEELDACFVVKDSRGQKLAYGYFEEEPGRRSKSK
jgi:hypothetical protein